MLDRLRVKSLGVGEILKRQPVDSVKTLAIGKCFGICPKPIIDSPISLTSKSDDGSEDEFEDYNSMLTVQPVISLSLVCDESVSGFNIAKTNISDPTRQEKTYWTNILIDRTSQCGNVHSEVAIAYFRLGHACLNCHDYQLAMRAFIKAFKIYRVLNKELACAQALDAYGLACIISPKSNPRDETLQKAEIALKIAFQIRCHHLGVWHADTVETYNKLASVNNHMGHFAKAAIQYTEVFKLRRAIFGGIHPSVAVTAHILATVFCKLGKITESKTFFAMAQRIYKQMGLSQGHPTVAKLLRDQAMCHQKNLKEDKSK